jgi:hypothetical protein
MKNFMDNGQSKVLASCKIMRSPRVCVCVCVCVCAPLGGGHACKIQMLVCTISKCIHT